MVTANATTGAPAYDKPVNVVIGHLSHAPALAKGQVLVRGLYTHGANGRAEVTVSMDANAMARKMAARETLSETGVSTTGVESLFSSL